MPADDHDSAIGPTIRRLRVAAERNQEWVAWRMAGLGHEMSPATIGKIERGERKVSFGEAIAFADAFGVSLDNLAGGVSEKELADREWEDALDGVRLAAIEANEKMAKRILLAEQPELGLTQRQRWQIEREIIEFAPWRIAIEGGLTSKTMEELGAIRTAASEALDEARDAGQWKVEYSKPLLSAFLDSIEKPMQLDWKDMLVRAGRDDQRDYDAAEETDGMD